MTSLKTGLKNKDMEETFDIQGKEESMEDHLKHPRINRLKKQTRFLIHEFTESKLAMVGLVITTIIVFWGLLGPWLATHDPNQMNLDKVMASISTEHILGCDQMGRDIWSRLCYGAQQVIWVAFIVILIGYAIGITLGCIAGYYGKWTETVIMRFMDSWMAMPGLLLLLLLIAAMEPSMTTVIIAMSIAGTPHLVRLVRGMVLAEKQKEYVEAAVLLGESDLYIMFSHIVPNIVSPLLVTASVRASTTIIQFAGLSYLGLGPPPPDPSWGTMLKESQRYMEVHPSLVIIPGIVISLAVIGLNLFGDGLRDILDPRLKDK